MALSATATHEALHPRAIEFTGQARGIERRLGLLFAGTGVALVAGMQVFRFAHSRTVYRARITQYAAMLSWAFR